MRPAPSAFTAWDALLAAALAGACLVLLLRPAPRALTVELVSEAGTRALALEERRRIEVMGPLGATVVELGGGGVRIASSPCPNRLCVKAGRLTRPGQAAACVPNRVAVRLRGRGRSANGEGVDAVAR